jgi:coatomer subunit alpha
LKQEGCADIALLFEKDVRTRFDLCVSSGDIKKAYETAVELKEKDVF